MPTTAFAMMSVTSTKIVMRKDLASASAGRLRLGLAGESVNAQALPSQDAQVAQTCSRRRAPSG